MRRPRDTESYVEAARRRVVIYDGATGTWLQTQNLTADDFGGPQLEGCNEILGVTRPDVIERFHRNYCELGVDVIETNTFGAFSVPLAEYGLADRDREISRANAAIARAVADEYGIWVRLDRSGHQVRVTRPGGPEWRRC